jgi:hypothetical protein
MYVIYDYTMSHQLQAAICMKQMPFAKAMVELVMTFAYSTSHKTPPAKRSAHLRFQRKEMVNHFAWHGE